ncbi:hypothetical protein HDU93_006402 [Gonapodya sp. JEL0774]|nr:hypothetical protein HDU93_006402 [Gonapodya sp. JEL0774]
MDSANNTFFAPTDEAIQELNRTVGLPKNSSIIHEALLYHLVLNYNVSASTILNGELIATALVLPTLKNRSQALRCDDRNGQHFVNLARIVEEDLGTANGMIQVINRVLIPPPDLFDLTFVLPTELSVFTSAAQRLGFDTIFESGKEITLFAPTNEAFRHLSLRELLYLFSPLGRRTLRSILAYHVAPSLVYSNTLHDLQNHTVATFLSTADPNKNATLTVRAERNGRWIASMQRMVTQKVLKWVKGGGDVHIKDNAWHITINDEVEVWFADR